MSVESETLLELENKEMEEEVNQDTEEEVEGSDNEEKPSLPAHLLPKSMTKKSQTTPGLIYLSRIPPGMGPSKVRHLLSKYGEIGKVYLARPESAKAKTTKLKDGRVKSTHQSHNFVEGWVEFLDKRVARATASLLNAKTIGGKKGNRFWDDVWTMKYLPKFRWDDLGEQIALEKAKQTALLRMSIQKSKMDQENYLAQVEKARVDDKISAKRAQAASEGKKRTREDEPTEGKKKREFKQRKVVEKNTRDDAALDSVLGKLF